MHEPLIKKATQKNIGKSDVVSLRRVNFNLMNFTLRHNIRGAVKKSWQPCCFSSHVCIYTKMAVSASNMNLSLSYHLIWTVLHAWLHCSISIKTMHFVHCRKNREARFKKGSTWIGVLLHILMYLRNKSMEYSYFWNTVLSIN